MPLWPFGRKKAESDRDDKSLALVMYNDRTRRYKPRQKPFKAKKAGGHDEQKLRQCSPSGTAKHRVGKASSSTRGPLTSQCLSVTDLVKLQKEKNEERLQAMKARPPSVTEMANIVRSRSAERGRASSMNRKRSKGNKARSVSIRSERDIGASHQSPKDLRAQMYMTKMSRYLDGGVENGLPGDELKSCPFEWTAKKIMTSDDYAENMTREMLCVQARPIAGELLKRDMNTVRRTPQRRASAWNVLGQYAGLRKNGSKKPARPFSVPPLFRQRREKDTSKKAPDKVKEGDGAGALEDTMAKSEEVMEGVSDVFNRILSKKRDNTPTLKKQLSDRLTVQQYLEKQKDVATRGAPKLEKSVSAKVLNPLGAVRGLVGESKGSPKRGSTEAGDKGKQLVVVNRAPPQLRGASSRNLRPRSAPMRGQTPAAAPKVAGNPQDRKDTPGMKKPNVLKSIREKRPDQYKELSVHHGWDDSAKGDTVRSIFGQRPKISKLGFGNDDPAVTSDSD